MSWADLQRGFAAGLPDPSVPAPGCLAGAGDETARRYAVYRNNHVSGLVDVLADSYPVVRRLVGTEFFAAMAAEYVRAHPPSSPVMLEYGQVFGDFVAGFRPAAGFGYLADVARLERLMTESLHAADAPPLGIAALQELPPDSLPGLRVRPHPAARFFSSDWPVVSIWRAHRTANDGAMNLADAGAECAIIARPDMTIDLHDAGPAAYAFLAALCGGSTLGEAAGRLPGDAEDALPGLLQSAFGLGLVAGLETTTTTSGET
jgi:hypothetical protein